MDNTGSKIQASAHFVIETDGTFSAYALSGIKGITTVVDNSIDVQLTQGVSGNDNVVSCIGDDDHACSYRFLGGAFDTMRITWSGGPTFPRHIDLTVLFVAQTDPIAGTILVP